MKNPFKPTAGAYPPEIVDRDHALELFEEGLNDGPGSPGLLSFITGPRGIGKTVTLGQAQELAEKSGWMVFPDTAHPGFVGRTAELVDTALQEFGSRPRGAKLAGFTAAGFGATFSISPEAQIYWRGKLTELLDFLSAQETGLLITLDEIQGANTAELVEFAATIQHMIREGKPIAVVMAGLSETVSDLLNEKVVTFLRRAEKIVLHDADIPLVRAAFESTFRETGVAVSDEHLDRLATATGGYPFMIQLVGHNVWRLAYRSGSVTTDEIVGQGLDAANRKLGSMVVEPAYAGLSDTDKTFLVKMAEDDGPSRTSDIGARLGVNAQYANMYRTRLIDAQVIHQTSWGHVNFLIPGMRQYLREHAASVINPAAENHS